MCEEGAALPAGTAAEAAAVADILLNTGLRVWLRRLLHIATLLQPAAVAACTACCCFAAVVGAECSIAAPVSGVAAAVLVVVREDKNGPDLEQAVLLMTHGSMQVVELPLGCHEQQGGQDEPHHQRAAHCQDAATWLSAAAAVLLHASAVLLVCCSSWCAGCCCS